jgi:gliding motility-associated protein GldE
LGYEILFYVAIFVILLGLSAFFSGSETAYFSLPRSEIGIFEISPERSENRVAKLISQPRQLLITIIVGNTIVNITTASLAAVLTTRLCEKFNFNPEIGILLNVVVVTLVILITSEIIPKVIAVRNPRAYSRTVSGFLTILFYLFYPITYLLTRFTRFVQNSVGFTVDKTHLSEEELKVLVEVGAEHGTLEKDEKEMIHSIFEFGETTVKEIMVPRTDMVCVEAGSTLSQVMELVKSKLLSRIPVYENRIDNIIGILYVKDLLPFISRKRHERFDLKKLARPAYFVPEQKMIDDLLRHFQKERIHMALVVDEYGGIAGLVTLEDVIEEIVGEIQDEHDKEFPLYTKIDKNTYVVDGRMSIEEINEEFHLNLPTEEGVETISGFILSLLGTLPEEKEVTRYGKHQFVIEKVAKNRILKVRIEKNKPDINIENPISE